MITSDFKFPFVLIPSLSWYFLAYLIWAEENSDSPQMTRVFVGRLLCLLCTSTYQHYLRHGFGMFCGFSLEGRGAELNTQPFTHFDYCATEFSLSPSPINVVRLPAHCWVFHTPLEKGG